MYKHHFVQTSQEFNIGMLSDHQNATCNYIVECHLKIFIKTCVIYEKAYYFCFPQYVIM